MLADLCRYFLIHRLDSILPFAELNTNIDLDKSRNPTISSMDGVSMRNSSTYLTRIPFSKILLKYRSSMIDVLPYQHMDTFFYRVSRQNHLIWILLQNLVTGKISCVSSADRSYSVKYLLHLSIPHLPICLFQYRKCPNSY